MITPPSTATPPPDPTGSTARMARSRHSPPFSFCCKTQDLVKHKGGLSEKQMHPGTRNGLYTILYHCIGTYWVHYMPCIYMYIYNLTNHNYICTHDFGIILDEWYTIVFGIISYYFSIIVVAACTVVCGENHSQPGVKFFTSHGATPHRNPRNLRHPTPEKHLNVSKPKK